MIEGETPTLRQIYQDGPDFYDADTDELICSYRDMVENDEDIEGARKARKLFQETHPGVVFVF